jgi:putative transposase
MRKSRLTEAQIVGIIKEQEAGMPTAEVCGRHGLSSASFYKITSKYGALWRYDYNNVRPHSSL